MARKRDSRKSVPGALPAKDVPHLVGVFRYRDTDIFLARLHVVEQTEIDCGGVLGEKGEIYPHYRARSRRVDKDSRARS